MSKRDEIAAAAVAVFARHGFAHTSMDLVAQAAGVSRPALYQYFRNKQDVFAAVAESVTGRIVAAAERARDTEGPLADRVHGVLRVKLDAAGSAGAPGAGFPQELVAQAAAMGLTPADDRLVYLLARLLDGTPEPVETAAALLAATAGIARSEGGPEVHRRRLRRLTELVMAGLAVG
ncbi:TetR/AcrR family transcriptional regulator [Streptomyces sp. NPDC093252]|uniref:TetR/AcrR family transcriptional regulator n=1 Tax=Streptomyces sp. NPDC093252 TaxID=3154980 RepID=UPI003417E14E